MDKGEKKQMRQQLREQQRAADRNRFPLPAAELTNMFDMLDVELPRQGCDHSRRITKAWLDSRGFDVDAVFAWLDDNGGFCDCEALANSEEAFKNAMHDAE